LLKWQFAGQPVNGVPPAKGIVASCFWKLRA